MQSNGIPRPRRMLRIDHGRLAPAFSNSFDEIKEYLATEETPSR